MKLSPPSHGHAERGDGRDEDQGAAFSRGRHARKMRAGATAGVTDSARAGPFDFARTAGASSLFG
jgi:hypothetical protein